MNTIKSIKEEFQNMIHSGKINIFEIEVINKETAETDYIIFEIEIYKNSFFVSFVPLTHKQEKSKKIAHFTEKIDKFYSLNKHLESLYTKCIDQLINSDFYELSND